MINNEWRSNESHKEGGNDKEKRERGKKRVQIEGKHNKAETRRRLQNKVERRNCLEIGDKGYNAELLGIVLIEII